MNHPELAIVLLHYNSLNHLQQFLPSVIRYNSLEASIYIIDNNSSDDASRLFIAQNYPEIHWIQLDKNYGYAGGYYHGLKQIKEPYWILLNSDVEVTEHWQEPLVDRLTSNDKLAAIQPKINSEQQQHYFEHAGAAGGFLDVLAYPYCRGRIFNEIEEDCSQYDDYIECFWASGACLAIKREAYFEAGEFDPRFFMHMEEIDLCWRLQRLGYTIACEPKSKIYHLGGGVLQYDNPKKVFYNFRNNYICIQKNQSLFRFLLLAYFRLSLDNIEILRKLLRFKFGYAFAIIKAQLMYVLGILFWSGAYNCKTKSNHTKQSKFSIVFEFFLRNNTKYSSLPHEGTNNRS